MKFILFANIIILTVSTKTSLFAFVSKNQNHTQKTVWERIMEEQSYININKGVYYLNLQDYSKASIEFLKSIEKNPSSMAYALYGASLYWLGDNNGALLNYDKAIDMDPKNDVAWQLKGISFARNMELDKALDCFKKALELNPKRSDVLMNIGSVYFSMNNIAQSIIYLKNAIRVDDKNPLLYYQLGLVYFNMGDYENSIKNFNIALNNKPDYEDAALWLGISYEKNGETEKAIKMYKKSIELKPYDFFARYKLLRLIKLKGNEMRDKISPCLELAPDNDKGGIGLQISYSINKKNGEDISSKPAIRTLYDNIMKIDRDEEAIINIDIIEMENITLETKKEGELEKKFLQKYKPLTYRIKSKTYEISSDIQKREKAIQIAREIEKEIVEGSNYRINFNIQTKKTAKILSEERELTYIPRNVGNDMGLWIIGNPWISVIEEDIENDKDQNPFINALGFLLIGNIKSSKKAFEDAFSLDPFLSYLGSGVINYLEGDKEEAVKNFEKAVSIDPKNKTANKNLKWIKGGKWK
ncbi:MAG: tetratricopeptide repeat protein [Elusimicrobiota bacterium]